MKCVLFLGTLHIRHSLPVQVMHYQDDEVPEAKFSYDISPLATVISSKKRAWYEFLTSLMAIIGGTFTGECV